MEGGARRNWERQGIPNGWAGRSEPTRTECRADMWNTKLMCTRRAESTQRNIRTNEGRQIWRALSRSDLKVRRAIWPYWPFNYSPTPCRSVYYDRETYISTSLKILFVFQPTVNFIYAIIYIQLIWADTDQLGCSVYHCTKYFRWRSCRSDDTYNMVCVYKPK